MKLYYDNSGTWTEVTAVVSYPTIRKMNNMYGSCTVILRDFEGSLYGTWYTRDFTEMKVEDDSSNIIFRGFLIAKTYFHNQLVLELAGLGIKLDWVKFQRNYILAQGKVAAIHADAELHVYNDVNEDDVDDGASEDFGWGVNQWTLGSQDTGLLIVDNTNSVTQKVWVCSADIVTNDDSHTGDFNDLLAQDEGSNMEIRESNPISDTHFIAQLEVQLDGFNIPDSVYIQQIDIRYKFGHDNLWFNQDPIDTDSSYLAQLGLYIYYDGGWQYTGRSAYTIYPYFIGSQHTDKWVSGTKTLIGTAAELAKYVTAAGGFFDHLDLKLDLTSRNLWEPRNAYHWIWADYFEVTVHYISQDISPIMEPIASNTAEGITITGFDWTATGVAVNDIFYIGQNTTQILNDISGDVGIDIAISSTLSKYIARNFKGVQCIDALDSICQLEGLEWYEDYAGNRIVVIKKADFVDNGIDLTSANYEWTWEFEDKCNQIREFHVWGRASYNIHAAAIDESVSGYASRQIIDDSILTQADAQEVADTQLALLKDKRPSIKLTMDGINSSLELGTKTHITFVRPTIAQAFYHIRLIERKPKGIDGIETTIFFGLGETTDIEFIGKAIRKANRLARKTLADKLISTPWSAGALITWGDVVGGAGGAVAAVNAAGLALASTKVITSADEDLTFIFGRAQIDSRFADMMLISHRDMSAQDNYAFGQLNDGKTYINTPTGKLIYFNVNDVTKISMSAASLNMVIPIAMGTNKITGCADPAAAQDVATKAYHDAYVNAQHNRDIYSTHVIPTNGFTSGANNTYFSGANILHGVTSLVNSETWFTYVLPSDYVEGQDLTFTISYYINAGSATIDYNALFQYSADSEAYIVANNPAGQWTSDATANQNKTETLTVTGTNLLVGMKLRLRVRMDDNGAAQILNETGHTLSIPVNSKV